MWRREDETQTLLRESAEGYLSTHHSTARFRACRKSEGGFDPQFWARMGELGWTGILLPSTMNGSELGLPPALIVAELLGKHLVPEPFVAAAVMAGTVLAASDKPGAIELGSELAAGRSVVLLADQEETGVVGTKLPRTRVERKGDRLHLSGSKVFVPTWIPSAQVIVSAQLDGEFCLVGIAPHQTNVDISPSRMCDGTMAAGMVFRSCQIGDEQILIHGQPAEHALRFATANGTLALSAQLEGLARQLHHMTAEYLLQRVQFGKPLASFQSLRHGLADLHVELELAAAAWNGAAEAMAEGLTPHALGSVSAAKARCSETALAVSRKAIQFHGAFGYTEEADIGLFVNAALRWASWLGGPQAHRRNALELHRQAAHA